MPISFCPCGDCPSKSVCSTSFVSTSQKRDSYSLKLGTLMVRSNGTYDMTFVFPGCIFFFIT
uniref:Uncharacterized protein n=1 Tax=Medicago truncatula TaxID=3880 RepID=A2Q1U6_MEDTR|nr:hypothetical protein MtrDRAFT_AC149129g33v2 [Medicago truncatula]